MDLAYVRALPMLMNPKNYGNLLKIVFSSTLPCSEFLKKCLWHGDEINCTEIFVQVGIND